eukprot:1196099-Prorocentrum_minimum.AAC.3
MPGPPQMGCLDLARRSSAHSDAHPRKANRPQARGSTKQRNTITSFVFTGPPVLVTARVHITPQWEHTTPYIPNGSVLNGSGCEKKSMQHDLRESALLRCPIHDSLQGQMTMPGFPQMEQTGKQRYVTMRELQQTVLRSLKGM